MKTTAILKRTNMMILLILASIFICALVAGQTSLAYANRNSDSKIDECQSFYNDDEEVIAERDRLASTTAADYPMGPFEEDKGSCTRPNTFHAYPKNKVTRSINGKKFEFVYDFRGYYGEPGSGWGRRANVQYFYNSDTKDMVFLTFGNPTSRGYRTYSYFSAADNTILENNIGYGDWGKYTIADNVQRCFIDPKINGLGAFCFQCCQNLKEVDVINQEYSVCQLGKGNGYDPVTNLCKGSFRKAGYDNDKRETKTPTEVNILKAFDRNKINDLLSKGQRERWAGYCRVKFEGVEYNPVN